MKIIPAYSKKQFDGYTHRFKVEFKTGEPYDTSMDIYSNSDSKYDLGAFIERNKSEKVISFRIVNVSSKEQDDLASKFIEEHLINI